ncbi:MAG: Gfo/Idh/MocA family oxidoreductase [Clostridia bacterium]|nr:Gfo/Idh/MocA family oxidoreductase [Clostridia bacterium]
MEKLKIGVVGAGNIAKNAHLPAYKKCYNCTPVAICDLDFERAKRVAEQYEIPEVYASAEEMIAKADIDAVDICTWNNAHAPVLIAAANAGKHVICEKPLAMNLFDALLMEKAVKENGIIFMLAVPSRFGYENMYLRDMYDNGELGEVYYAKTSYIRRRGTPLGWFTDKKTSGGGPIIDIGVHRIDAAWYLMGTPKPTRVSANVFTKIGDYQTKGVGRWHGISAPDNQFDTEDSGTGVIHFENGASMVFEASWAINAPDKSETLICGTKAGATVEPLVIYGERNQYLSDDKVTVNNTNDKFKLELEHFADCVLRGDHNTKYPIEQAVDMQRMLQAIYDSAAEGREIVLGE